jgi:hypothetical protein
MGGDATRRYLRHARTMPPSVVGKVLPLPPP